MDTVDGIAHRRSPRRDAREIETFPRGDRKRAALIFQINYSAAFRGIMAYRYGAGPPLSQSRAILARCTCAPFGLIERYYIAACRRHDARDTQSL